jgi:hypothetical protein
LVRSASLSTLGKTFPSILIFSSYFFIVSTTAEDGVLHIELTKAEEASTWLSAIAGHQIDLAKQQADQKRLMLERFQQEHPGFDFSGAQFTGEIPDPRKFMKDLDK